MHPPYRGRHARIRQTAQQARRRVIALQGPQRSISSTSTSRESTDRGPACVAGFFAQEPRQRREPVGAAHVHQRRQQRHQKFGVGRVEDEVAAEQPHIGIAIGPPVSDLITGAPALGSMTSGVTGSKPEMTKPGVAGRSTKSPASSVMAPGHRHGGDHPPTPCRAGLSKVGVANAPTPAPLMPLASTVRGRSSAMTSESGSVISGP